MREKIREFIERGELLKAHFQVNNIPIPSLTNANTNGYTSPTNYESPTPTTQCCPICYPQVNWALMKKIQREIIEGTQKYLPIHKKDIELKEIEISCTGKTEDDPKLPIDMDDTLVEPLGTLLPIDRPFQLLSSSR